MTINQNLRIPNPALPLLIRHCVREALFLTYAGRVMDADMYFGRNGENLLQLQSPLGVKVDTIRIGVSFDNDSQYYAMRAVR